MTGMGHQETILAAPGDRLSSAISGLYLRLTQAINVFIQVIYFFVDLDVGRLGDVLQVAVVIVVWFFSPGVRWRRGQFITTSAGGQ